MKVHLINNRVSIKENENGKLTLLVDNVEQEFNLPTSSSISSPTEKIKLFDGFRNEKSNHYYVQISIIGRGWFSIYKKGKHIGKYEPQPDLYHPHSFVAAGDMNGKDNKKFHQSHHRN